MKAILNDASPPIDTMTAGSGCADCWYTKLADATEKTSPLALGFAKAALAMTESKSLSLADLRLRLLKGLLSF